MPQRHSQVEQIVLSTLAAVAPETLVRRHVRLAGKNLTIDRHEIQLADRPIVCLGAGKASGRMALALTHVLGKPFHDGFLTGPAGYDCEAPGVQGMVAGHPIPNERSMQAATKALALAQTYSQGKPLVFGLMSGGASALWCKPRDGLSLADKIEAGKWLLSSGLNIEQMNAIRRRLSAIKGGHLSAAFAEAEIHVLVLSDVPHSPRLDIVGSGPFHHDPTTAEEALLAMSETRLAAPPWLEEAVAQSPPPPAAAYFQQVKHYRIGSNQDATLSASLNVVQIGYHPIYYNEPLDGEASEVGRMLAELAQGFTAHRPTCLIFGGETTVTLSAKPGRGGRNQELALAFSLAIKGKKNISLLAFSTDGIDGVTDAAGAYVDGKTADRIRQSGLNPLAHLTEHDANPALAAADALVRIGPTGTNVADVVLVFID